jgi:hypothetical protein
MFGNRRAVQGGLHRPPRHPIVGGDLGDGATGVDHRIQQRRSQPGGAASPQRQLVGGRDEGPSSTGRLGTHQPRLAHHHLHPAGVRDIAHPLPHPGVHPRRHHPTLRTARVKINRLYLDSAAAQWQIDRLDHPISGQVEDHARSVTPRARRLEHSSWSFLDGCVNTPISAQGHEPLHQQLTTPNCEVPLWDASVRLGRPVGRRVPPRVRRLDPAAARERLRGPRPDRDPGP